MASLRFGLHTIGRQIQAAVKTVQHKSNEVHKDSSADSAAVRSQLDQVTAEKLALESLLEAERSKTQDTEGQREQMRALLAEQSLQIGKLEQDIRSLMENSQASVSIRLIELEHRYNEATDSIKARDAVIATMELNCKCDEKQREIEAITRETERTVTDLKQSHKIEVQRKDSKIDELHGKLEAYDLKITQLEAQSTEKDQSYEELQTNLESSNTELEEIQKSLKSKTSELNASKAEVARLKQLLEELEQDEADEEGQTVPDKSKGGSEDLAEEGKEEEEIITKKKRMRRRRGGRKT
jgi:chromosome segregation protein